MGVGEGQGDLVCCSPWAHKVSHGHDSVAELNERIRNRLTNIDNSLVVAKR